MKKNIVVFILMFACAAVVVPVRAQTLRISDNHRYIVREDGTPFFYLGDTGWGLFSGLSREDLDFYLTKRAEQGFTVIQATVLRGRWNPENPNEEHYQNVDYVVAKAEELGLMIGMLPTWGNAWSGSNPIFTPETAYSYGKFLGTRYKGKSVIWILGGDQNIRNDNERAIIDALAKGLGDGDGGEHLITFHPRGPGLSSDYFHNADWLDFDMYQSSHAAQDHDNGLFAQHDYKLNPPKPTMDGEPRYETIPVSFYFEGFNPMVRFDDYDVRQAAYWSMLAGACGHTYGNNSVFQFHSGKGEGGINALIPWKMALNNPGAYQMGFMRKLFDSRPYQLLVPNYEIVLDGPGTGGAKIRAAVASDHSFAFIYSPRGEKFTLDKSLIPAQRHNEIWFDPRYGVSYILDEGDTQGIQTYTPPTSGRGCDWILIIEDKDKQYPLQIF